MNGDAPSRRSRFEIERKLLDAVEQTKARYKNARQEFLNSTELHYDSPDDSILAIKRSAAANQKAFDEYREALHRFTAFVTNGVIPKDLK